MAEDTVKRTIKRPFYSYAAPLLDANGEQIIGPDGRARFFQKLGYKGDTVDLYAADAARGDKHDVFLTEGENLEGAATEAVRLSDIGLLTDDQLALLWEDKPPTVASLIEAVGDNAELAQKVLDTEQAAGGKPRKSLNEALESVIEAGKEQS